MLDRKATDQGWNNASSAQQIGLFNITHNGAPTTINITKEHGHIEMAALRAQCKRFMIGEDSPHQAHQEQSDAAGMHFGIASAKGPATPCSVQG